MAWMRKGGGGYEGGEGEGRAMVEVGACGYGWVDVWAGGGWMGPGGGIYVLALGQGWRYDFPCVA